MSYYFGVVVLEVSIGLTEHSTISYYLIVRVGWLVYSVRHLFGIVRDPTSVMRLTDFRVENRLIVTVREQADENGKLTDYLCLKAVEANLNRMPNSLHRFSAGLVKGFSLKRLNVVSNITVRETDVVIYLALLAANFFGGMEHLIGCINGV